MIEELEASAIKLATSEREQAWREMAKQVAHEIKNPLTPMRLSVQSFQRKFDPKDPDIHNKVKDELSHFIENRSLEEAVKYIILTSFNWGGTILGLWMAYKYCNEKYDKNYDDNNIYISHFEEDFCPINNNNWLKTSKNMLNNTLQLG